ncbi:DVU_1553 family AMP-dependent CoA ligase [Salidesulfovibrio onnuriiensis]|uniref:DVU_1553 family AMP-dependent CoA ligase n=1 Tax=Salidesulfovibrio onnuriiensis TaxID=2583823 RepID=UPI0011CCB862|nr:AMP-binding protein [Salidesulfovibrio onnuriiensis]
MGLPPLDRWLMRRMGLREKSGAPSPKQVRAWQLEKLRETVAHAKAHSPFYARLYSEVSPGDIRTMEDFARLPAITPKDLRDAPEQLLCVSQDDIARVVTLQSSGTTGKPKRVFHTGDDLEATVDYFDWGMRSMVEPGQTALVLMPGDRPGGVGRLLMEALGRNRAQAVAYGVLEDASQAVDTLLETNARCIVGPAAHVNMLARHWEKRGLPEDRIRSVLLCWDAIPNAVVRNAKQAFGCRVFRHWGMIETGLGGAVECAPGSGLHLRETDVHVEIVDPKTGEVLPDGRFGEIVVSTALRRGMPLLRYRTGDRGRILPGACACGSPLRRLDPHIKRLEQHSPVTLLELGEALYSLPEVHDFHATLKGAALTVRICGQGSRLEEKARAAINNILAVRHATDTNSLRIEITAEESHAPAISGLGKRTMG